MEKSALYLEIFGGDGLDEIAPVIYPRPLPLIDDELRDFTKSDGTAAGLCSRLADDAFVSELIGDTEDQSTRGRLTLGELLEKHAPSRNFIEDVLHYADRARELEKSEPRRKREISAIVDRWADKFNIPAARFKPELDRVKESATKCVQGILMEVEA